MKIEYNKKSLYGRFIFHKIQFETAHFHPDVFNNISNCYVPYTFGNWKVPKGYKNELISLTNCKGFLLSKDTGNHVKVVYQLHGGAYVGAYNDNYNKNALLHSKTFDDCDVFSIDYRVADVSPFPAAVDDALEGYRWLLKNNYKPENIVFAGDSAGGGLALALALKLRDLDEVMPKCLLLCSPWTDVAQEGDSYTFNRKNDPAFGSKKEGAEKSIALPVKYADGDDVHNPLISPVFASYENMPPMQIQVGTAEMLLSDSLTVYEKAIAAGVDAEIILYKDMYHTFYTAQRRFPEQKEAWKRIEEYLHK